MKNNLIIVFILLSTIGFAQQDWLEVSKEAIVKNKIFKVVEYDAQDSIDFFKKYPNGSYYRFDYKGNLIEQNGYSPSNFKGKFDNGEFVAFYNYDSSGNRIAFVQIDRFSKNPIRKVNLSKKTSNDSISIVNYDDLSNQEYSTRKTSSIELNIGAFDTIVLSPAILKVIYKEDTAFTNYIYKNQFNQVDSIIEYKSCSSSGRKYQCIDKIIFEYYEHDRELISKKSIIEFDKKRNQFQLYSLHEYSYLKNGLLEKYKSTYGKDEKIFERKFKYYH